MHAMTISQSLEDRPSQQSCMEVPALNLITVVIKFQHEVWKRQPNWNKTVLYYQLQR